MDFAWLKTNPYLNDSIASSTSSDSVRVSEALVKKAKNKGPTNRRKVLCARR